MRRLHIHESTDDASADIALDTARLGKQTIIFVNSKRSAEALAEKIAKNSAQQDACLSLAEAALTCMSRPTKQCSRLALVLKKGAAFHHAGLHSAQREIVEEGFRDGTIRTICATPTLAYGLDLPAFRVIVRDLKRYGRRGMEDIPVLEYQQMCGRAGRPGKEEYGEAVAVANSEKERERINAAYVNGEPEEIYSKLAVEPVLRMYVLSLIASNFVTDEEALVDFFGKTFYGHQYRDLEAIRRILDKTLHLLQDWEFINMDDDFVPADRIGKSGTFAATPLGKRVSELYLDPLSAHGIITCIKNATRKGQAVHPFSYLFLISRCNELEPLIPVRVKDIETLNETFVSDEQYILEEIPGEYSEEYEDFMRSYKTARFFSEWMDEKDEEYLLETYNIRPGEIHAKLDRADWLIFCAEDLARILHFPSIVRDAAKIRIRLEYGAREEILPLLKLKNIGRVRARLLYSKGYTTLDSIRKSDQSVLGNIIGKGIAADIKKQVGAEEMEPVKQNKRKGQINLEDYDEK